MLIIKVDLPDSEPLQTRITTLADIFGPAVHAEKLALFITDISKLGGQDHLVTAALYRPTHEFFIDPATIHVGGVEEVDAQIECPMNRGNGFLVVTRSIEFRHSHAAQAQCRHGQSLCSKFSLFHKQVFVICENRFVESLSPNPNLTRIISSSVRCWNSSPKFCIVFYMDTDLTGFSTAQQRAYFDLLILAMYADGHLTTFEDEQLQKVLAMMGFTEEIDRQREFDAALTRIRPSLKSIQTAKDRALLLADAFTTRALQKRVFEAVEQIMTFDQHVSTWESTLLMELRMKFRL